MFELRYGIMDNGERYEDKRTKMRNFRHCFRSVMGVFHFISDADWLYGEIYEDNILVGKMDNYGCFTFIIDGEEVKPRGAVYSGMSYARSMEEIKNIYKNGDKNVHY
ncbi:MAG: hypothetical protein PUF57_08730 [Clostridiaceae bacterium]|nr:hypothetical protein [Clostridiaceae bacterium]